MKMKTIEKMLWLSIVFLTISAGTLAMSAAFSIVHMECTSRHGR